MSQRQRHSGIAPGAVSKTLDAMTQRPTAVMSKTNENMAIIEKGNLRATCFPQAVATSRSRTAERMRDMMEWKFARCWHRPAENVSPSCIEMDSADQGIKQSVHDAKKTRRLAERAAVVLCRQTTKNRTASCAPSCHQSKPHAPEQSKNK